MLGRSLLLENHSHRSSLQSREIFYFKYSSRSKNIFPHSLEKINYYSLSEYLKEPLRFDFPPKVYIAESDPTLDTFGNHLKQFVFVFFRFRHLNFDSLSDVEGRSDSFTTYSARVFRQAGSGEQGRKVLPGLGDEEDSNNETDFPTPLSQMDLARLLLFRWWEIQFFKHFLVYLLI